MQTRVRVSLGEISVTVLLAVAVQASPAQAQVADRILSPIDNSRSLVLEGNVRPIFTTENDLGPVDNSFKLENMSLIFKRTESQQQDLTTLLDELRDPSSPSFQQWLTPEKFADRFGLSLSDFRRVMTWLQAQGFQITQTARSRNWISFSGTAAEVRMAFQTEIHQYIVRGDFYYANTSAPSVPGALADVILGIHALDNYPLHPRSVFRPVKAEPQPEFTSGISANTFVTPDDFAIIYDLNALYSAGIDGSGQSIAVVGQTDLYNGGSDITDFRSAAGLAASAPQIVLIPGASDPGVIPGDVDEASLDVEWSGAVARDATIIFVNGGKDGVFNALQYAVDNDTAPVISISYGACEAEWGTANLNAVAQLGQQANAQGQTLVAAAGDVGAADCDASTAPGTIISVATKGLAVDAPASLSSVTGMGGSEFNEGSGNYWKPATNGMDLSPSALSYIPEKAWNDTSTKNGIVASGGGASAHFAKPTWQAGTGVPDDNARDVPDVSLNASQHDGSLICVSGGCLKGFRNTDGDLSAAGGTSVAAPTFAGIVALINQQMKTPKGQGNINAILYSMAATSPAAFHDITTGNNKVPCEAGSTDCPTTGAMEIGYSAGVGYDQATGLGSVDAFNLVTAWGSRATGNLPAPALTAPANGATGAVLSPTFTWMPVTGSAGYRILIATNPADLPTHPGTITCSTCAIVATPSNNSYTPPSPLAAGVYYWQVQAVVPSSTAGTAAWSIAFSFTTTGATLAEPSLKAPASGATAVAFPPTFTWSAVSGSAGYRILISPMKTSLPTNPSVGTCGGCTLGATTTAASYTPSASSLMGSTTYYWQVQALPTSANGNGFWSSVSSFTTGAQDFSLSVSPTSVSLSPGNSGTSTVTLTPINNLSPGSVSLTCGPSSTLAGVLCTVGPLASDNTATVTINASTSASVFRGTPKNRASAAAPLLAVVAAFLLLIARVTLGRSRRNKSQCLVQGGRARRILLLVELGCLLAASLSCGGGGSSGGSGSQGPPPPESGSVIIQGATSTITHAVSISVSVS